MTESVIQIRGLGLRIGGKPILRDLSLDVFKGEYLSIIGPNGAGKTTLLACIGRLVQGATGSILIKGKPAADYSQKDLARQIGYVPQAGTRRLPFTVKEFAMMGRYPHLSPFSRPAAPDHEVIRAALALVGAESLKDRLLDTLSGGERQKVFIAAALTQEAQILLLDEPTTFLDPKHQDDIHLRLRRINKEWGVTIVSVTHDINSALLLSDRFAAIRAGQVCFSGSPREVTGPGILERIYGTQFLFAAHPATNQPMIIPKAPQP